MELTHSKNPGSFAFIAQVVFWLVALVMVTYLSAANFSGAHAFTRATLVFGCHLINFYVCYSLLMPRYYEKGKWLPFAGGIILLLILLSPFRYFIEKQFTADLHALNPRYVRRRLLKGVILLTEVTIVAVACLLRLAVSNEEKRSKMAALENLQLQTELRFLKAQMNPHFLFNTINNIYSLTLMKSDKASTALMKLSGMLRYLLYESTGKVSLKKELEALHAYIDLYRLRFEQPLAVEIVNEVPQQNIAIESLLLIPLMENALKHSATGIQPQAKVFMKISMQEPSRLAIYLYNTKADPPIEQETGGIGLLNIQKRLQFAYPGQYEWKVEDLATTFSVTLIVMTA